MARSVVGLCLLAVTVTLAGCFKADVTIPDYGGGAPPPPAYVAPANPNSQADLARENQQLRERIAYLEQANRKASQKYADLEGDKTKLQSENARIASERDRYKQAAGQ